MGWTRKECRVDRASQLKQFETNLAKALYETKAKGLRSEVHAYHLIAGYSLMGKTPVT
jgi:hypothetical protein